MQIFAEMFEILNRSMKASGRVSALVVKAAWHKAPDAADKPACFPVSAPGDIDREVVIRRKWNVQVCVYVLH